MFIFYTEVKASVHVYIYHLRVYVCNIVLVAQSISVPAFLCLSESAGVIYRRKINAVVICQVRH